LRIESGPKGDYGISIDYDKGSEQPARVFKSMSLLIETFQRIDLDLARSVATEIEPILILEEIEAGSIKAWFRTFLKAIPDGALRDCDWKKLLGAYMLLGKYRLLEFIGESDDIEDKKQLERLQSDLVKLAADTNVRQIPSYAPIPADRLLADLADLSTSLEPLSEMDVVTLVTSEREIEMNKSFTVTPEIIESIITEEEIESTATQILKVKKPDYLGKSMWQLRHGGHIFDAKILDEDWLHEFQDKDITVRPGDSLRADVRTRVSYDSQHEVIATHTDIIKVREVIASPYAVQGDLLEDGPTGDDDE